MAQYKKELKLKVLDVLVLVEDPDDMRDLIDKIVKINNRIYQQEQANKKYNKHIPVHKSPQQMQRQQYGGLEPMDFSGTKETQKGNGKNRLWKFKERGSNR